MVSASGGKNSLPYIVFLVERTCFIFPLFLFIKKLLVKVELVYETTLMYL